MPSHACHMHHHHLSVATMRDNGSNDDSRESGSSAASFSPFVSFCFTINYILGTGFLTIPWAFTQGGILLSTAVILTVGILSDMAKNYLLETMARASVLLDSNSNLKLACSEGNEIEGGEKQRLLSTNAVATTCSKDDGDVRKGTVCNGSLYVVQDDRKFEVNVLCRIFLGETGLHLYTLTVCLYLYGACWAFTSVFASALANAAPLFHDNDDSNYLFYAILFATIVVPLTCMELQEQVVLQVVLTGARFLLLGLMMGTSHLCAEDKLNNGEGDDIGFVPAPWFDPSGIPKMLPIIVFANIYHHGIPGLSQPVANKQLLGPIFSCSTLFITTIYTILGVTLSLAFGSQHMEQSSNLNWSNFMVGSIINDDDDDPYNNNHQAPLWAKAVSMYIVCFPALDVISAFPLNAITLGDNLLEAAYSYNETTSESNHHNNKNIRRRPVRICFRLLASVPPIVLGMFERRLGTITDYTGTTGLLMAFSFPAVLYLQSGRLLLAASTTTQGLSSSSSSSSSPMKTYYSSYASSTVLAWLLLVVGVVLYLFVLFNLVVVSLRE